jgi:cytochrome c-type biogenesis protein
MLYYAFSLSNKSLRDFNMSLVPGITSPYLGAFVGGLFYGTVFCTASCLPYVASYIAGTGSGFRKSIKITLIYNAGRVAAYALIGGAIGVLSGAFRMLLSEAAVLPFQEYSSIAFGIVTIAIGANILFSKKSPPCNHKLEKQGDFSGGKLSRRFDIGAFTLGLSRGLVICAPLLALLLTSLAFATPIDSFVLAVLFGVGTALSPILLLGGVTGWLLNKAPLFRKWISIFGAVVLMLLGVSAIITTMMAII